MRSVSIVSIGLLGLAAAPAQSFTPEPDPGAATRSPLGQPRALQDLQQAEESATAQGSGAYFVQLDLPTTTAAYRQGLAQGVNRARQLAAVQRTEIAESQRAVLAEVDDVPVLYRTFSALPGFAARLSTEQASALAGRSDVQGVYPIAAKRPTQATALPLQGAPTVWEQYANRGEGTRIGVIDTGIDYTHAMFGGPGTELAFARAEQRSHLAAASGVFPTGKVVGGFDFAGDDYDADGISGSTTPAPDPNPLDCQGHGTHVAGSAAGLGVTSAGTPFAGAYGEATPLEDLRIGPGVAPKAGLFAYRIFGCTGSSELLGAAIERSLDPNSDGDPSDRLDVVNLSLGSDFDSTFDGDSVLVNAAVAAGLNVVAAAGNAGDLYDVGGAPGNARRAITVANSVDSGAVTDALEIAAPAALAGSLPALRSLAYDWDADPDLSGPVAAFDDVNNPYACAPIAQSSAEVIAGKVALAPATGDLDDPPCGSATQAANLRAAGATGFILTGTQPALSFAVFGSSQIPGVVVSGRVANLLRGGLADGVHVGGTGAQEAVESLPERVDQLESSSSRGVRAAGGVKPDLAAVGSTVFSASVGTGALGQILSGTSMATPQVAGMVALIRKEHPLWAPGDIKAALVNTAVHDVFTGPNRTGSRYGPNRVGAGRVDAALALAPPGLARVVDDPGAVSVSFGPVSVAGERVLTRTVRLTNTTSQARRYTLRYEALVNMPGAQYSLSRQSLTLDPGTSGTFVVTLTLDGERLTRARDITVEERQVFLRQFVPEASGRVLIASSGAPTLRVPVYAAPRPVSTLTQPADLVLGGTAPARAALPLSGAGLNQGDQATGYQSRGAALETVISSAPLPRCTPTLIRGCVSFDEERAADLKLLGMTSTYEAERSRGRDPLAQGTLVVGLNVHRAMPNSAGAYELDLLIDRDQDGTIDLITYNTRVHGTDVLISSTIDANTGEVVDNTFLNDSANGRDRAVFDTDTLLYSLDLSDAGLDGPFDFGVLSYAYSQPEPLEFIGVTEEFGLDGSLSFDPTNPGVWAHGELTSSTNLVTYPDLPGSAVEIFRDAAADRANGDLGAMVVHLHNAVGAKSQQARFANRATSDVRLRPVASPVRVGSQVTTRIRVRNTAGRVPSGRVQLFRPGTGAVLGTAELSSGLARISFRPTVAGRMRLQARYLGDARYLASLSTKIRSLVIQRR